MSSFFPRRSLPFYQTFAGKVLLLVIALAILCYTAYAATSDKKEETTLQESLPPVEVLTLKAENINLWNKFSGRLKAVDMVEIKPRVGGEITEILFTEGAIVKKGDPLFVIDPRPYKAALAKAQAEVKASQSLVKLTQVNLERAKKLVRDNVVSKSRYDAALNDHNVAQAQLASAQASVTQETLNCEYAHIKAPVAGRVGRAELTVGNIIELGPNTPLLTTIVSHDPLYAEFEIDEQTYITSIRAKDKQNMAVELTLSGNDDVTYHGTIHSFDNKLDTNSGTIRARALIKNTDGALVSGMFATIKLATANDAPSVLIPDKAILTDQDKKYVYVITPDGTVEYRVVMLGQSVGGRRVVLSGLKEDEVIAVNGLQKIRPAMKVAPKLQDAS